MSKKPYMWGNLEYLEFSQRKDWNDPDTNPDDLAEYSELQRPYALPEGVDDYMSWEFSWPDINFPDIPPIVFPDPVPHPCNAEDSCHAVGIVGPAEMDCGDCYTWSHVHVITSCEPAWWMAFGSWTLDPGSTECYLLFSGPIMATVCCPDSGPSGTFMLSYQGPLECSDSIEVAVTCEECCEEFTLSGATTQATGTTWTGTISPACPCATCEVTSNSGCSVSCVINGAGSAVYVTAPDCGGVTVTVTDECAIGECEANTASHTFNVTGDGGDWYIKDAPMLPRGCAVDCGHGCNIDYYSSCIGQPYKYGSGCEPWMSHPCCIRGWSRQCKGCPPATCAGGSNSGPPCGGDKSCINGSHHYCDESPCWEGGGCCCASHNYWRCEWKCTC